MISAKVVADSVNEFNNRITTFEVVIPRIVLAELNTHRMFSRNSASSRAIPFNKMVEAVSENPFIPLAWQKSHSGMQGTEYHTDRKLIQFFESEWLNAKDNAISAAQILSEKYIPEFDDEGYPFNDDVNGSGVTKQLCNRLLEPFMYHKVLITATELENFFKLRCPSYSYQGIGKYRSWKDLVSDTFAGGANRDVVDELESADILTRLKNNSSQAEIHIQAVAECMWDALNESTPKELKAGEWHIPYGDNIDIDKIADAVYDINDSKIADFDSTTSVKIKISTARNARISYTVVGEEKAVNYEKDIELHDNLIASGHMSPTEHCAKTMSYEDLENYLVIEDNKVISGRCRNFTGFIQYRALVEKPL